jgi:hypothetical protein
MTTTTNRRICVACLNALAEPNQIKCADCSPTRLQRHKTGTPPQPDLNPSDALARFGIAVPRLDLSKLPDPTPEQIAAHLTG